MNFADRALFNQFLDLGGSQEKAMGEIHHEQYTVAVAGFNDS